VFNSLIVEDTLAKKPFAKQITHILLDGTLNTALDKSKLFLEVRKNLISEDFF